jgi:long-chain fatty acid transport protein
MALRRRPPRTTAALVLAACLTLARTLPADATNATNLLGYSAAAEGLAGAASVSVLDTSLINTNPASLFLLPDGVDRDPDSAIAGGVANFSVGVLQPYLHHTDVFGNSRESENNPFLVIHGGAALRFRALPRLTVGLGFFSQSGLGSDFRALKTAFGTRDDVSSYERFVKLQTAVSYQVTDDLAIGVGPYLGYSDLSLHLFPATSAPGFAGLANGDRCSRNFGLGEPGSDCPWDVVPGVKAGVTYRVTPIVTVGAAYTSPAHFHYHDGTADLNFTALGLGRVRYDDVSVSGITHPQFVQAGLAVRPTPRWLLALDLSWHNWAAFDHFTIHARNPNKPLAPAEVNLRQDTDWHDQYVIAIGTAWELMRDVLAVRAGYNLANNPIPSRTFSPAIQVPFEHHVSAGVGYRAGRHLEVDTAFVYAFEKKVRYTNPELPFGPNATEAPSGFSVDVTVGYRF